MEKLGSDHARVHAYCRGHSGRQVSGSQPVYVTRASLERAYAADGL